MKGYDKSGQVPETINWVVATIIIIVVLIFCFFIARGDVLNFDFQLFPDKQQDFVITKSVTNFVEENFELIKESAQNNDYVLLGERFDSFSENLPLVDESSWGWSFVLKDGDNKDLFETGHTLREYRNIEFVFNEPDFKIIFLEQCKECQPMYYTAH